MILPLCTAVLVAAIGLPPRLAAHVPERTAPVTYNGRANQINVRPPRLDEGGLVMDGMLSEPQWAQAALLTGFSQFSPNDGAAADDSTEVLVWYSATAIHFGIRAFEKHGAPRATLADRDRIASDDNIQILLGTFNDGRQATVFAVNPLGVQSDGTIVESNQRRSSGLGGTALARDATDVSADYVFASKGQVVADGYVVEMRIPFKSLKYQSSFEQTWGINVVRVVQHSGHENSWVPARRAGLSFLSQSGSLQALTDLRRGLVVDVNPEITQRSIGATRAVIGEARFDVNRPEVGVNARWGITSNLTLNGTVNPDFSQVESDAGQFTFDPRQSLFFSEKRPFFLDGMEQFATPHSLIYTRRIIQPVGAAKLTGKVAGTSVAFLSAVDDKVGSTSRRDNPYITLLRVQRDLGRSSKLGVAYTDRYDAGNYNRVADIDGNHLFGGIYSVQGQYATSFTKQAARTFDAPLWRVAVNRNGKRFGFGYSLDGVHEDFRALSGFLSRGGIVQAGFDHRFTTFGKPGALFESITFGPRYFSTWRYQSFVHSDEAIEKKLQFNLNASLRGGWGVGLGYFLETFGFDPALYASYRILGVNGDTLPFVGVPRIGNNDPFISFSTPQGRRISATVFYLVGRDENFSEWASSDIVYATYGVTARPTDKLRLNATYSLQSFNRRSDGSIVGNIRVPRLKMEYQIARPIFVRLVGEFNSVFRDALRDEGGGTGRPILTNDSCNGGVYGVTRACQRTRFRGDFLFSYQPNPGTVVFLGYGAGYADSRTAGLAEPFEFPSSLGLRGYNRTDDALFVKASYLFRL